MRDSSERRTSNGQLDYDQPRRLGGILWAMVGIGGFVGSLVVLLIVLDTMRATP
jgi:hypothetical protein